VEAGPAQPDWNEAHGRRFREAMDDDFNTAEAVAVLFDLANEVNRQASPALALQLRALGGLLGLLQREAQAYHQSLPAGAAGEAMTPENIEALIAERAAAKKAKDFARADGLRRQLLEAGIALEDKPGGMTEWRRV
jgi:cysteinyl-tRNA synthetase